MEKERGWRQVPVSNQQRGGDFAETRAVQPRPLASVREATPLRDIIVVSGVPGSAPRGLP